MNLSRSVKTLADADFRSRGTRTSSVSASAGQAPEIVSTPPTTPDSLTRRQFLTRAGAVLATSVLPSLVCEGAPPAVPGIIDTHTHFYDPTRSQGVPWPDKTDKLLYRRVSPEDYRRLAQPLGVSGTVVVEASSWIEDNQWVLDLAVKDKFIVGLVGHLEPGQAGFRNQLDRFAKNPLFRGIRVGGQLRSGMDRRDFMADLKRLSERDLALDALGGPDLLPVIATLARRLPELRIVIDHVANVRIDGKAPPAEWAEGMRSCGRQPNVYCKVSGLVEGTGRTDGAAPRDVGFYRPVLDVVWNSFGEDRVIYGSNWPVSERFAPLATVQEIVAGYFSFKGRTAAEKYFRRNASAVYKWS